MPSKINGVLNRHNSQRWEAADSGVPILAIPIPAASVPTIISSINWGITIDQQPERLNLFSCFVAIYRNTMINVLNPNLQFSTAFPNETHEGNVLWADFVTSLDEPFHDIQFTKPLELEGTINWVIAVSRPLFYGVNPNSGRMYLTVAGDQRSASGGGSVTMKN